MKKELWVPQAIAGGMLLWALYPENPYGYYVLLRWICCPCFAYTALQAFKQDKQNWVWILGVSAAIYNPLIPLHLNRELWSVLNLIGIGIGGWSIFVLKKEIDPAINKASRFTRKDTNMSGFQTNKERNWCKHPVLYEVIRDKAIPSDCYHYSGVRSPYTTRFDDIHDFAEIATVVVANKAKITDFVDQHPTLEGVEDDALLEGLIRECENLLGDVEWSSDFFRRKKDELASLRSELGKRVDGKRAAAYEAQRADAAKIQKQAK